ncbi:SH3 domain-containing protein [Leptothoe spongobia]|uniref:Uncharacterized protein n=1 Tax=Leptothoe spongobia TAU-MAC 1115 TaxID=1967444 RepID=A0A947DIT8_9CYAN|nr:SH3 domain-containing protein [Leptothoe spongobia]MBT9317235.1 hypothetical protein [Leptothoe spongobia TAU-MAC 1115]
MTRQMLSLFKQLGVAGGLILLGVPAALAEPGWRDWQKITGSNEPLPHSAGFSNLELGGYLEYEDRCAQAAFAAQEPFTYWYRLSDLVWEIGTGEVENRCQEGDKVVTTYSSRATLRAIDEPYCLQVNTDVGSGLRLREERSVESRQIGFLPNGTEIFPLSLPASIMTDETGRQWLLMEQRSDRTQLEGWASISSGIGEYVNFRLCSPDV